MAKITEALAAAGLTVWWDTAIEGGASFSADIERELDAADVVVVVWSATSIKSDWVRDEASAGRDRKRLVPVQIDATLPPLGFQQMQSLNLSGWKGRAGDAKFAALVSAIQKLAGSAAVAPVAKAAPATTGPSRRGLTGGAAGVAASAVGGFGVWRFIGGKVDDGTAGVVVLPFANLSGDPAQAFFSDGIAEELRNALSRIRGLKVIGRVSSEQFRDAKDVSVAAEKLGVDHVLTGSVRRSPTTIRIGAQLVDGKTGVESWSQSYDQPVGDALVVQSKIATSVVAALSARLATAAGTINVGGTNNPRAQELYLKGSRLFQTDPSEANIRRYIAWLNESVVLDPKYAEAWASLGYTKSNLAEFARSATERAALQGEAMAASQRAVALAPNSGWARVSLANQYEVGLDLRRAVAEAEKAMALAPADASVVSNAAWVIADVDPDRGASLAGDAVKLDPLNTWRIARYADLLSSAKRCQDAAQAARQVIDLSQGKYGRPQLLRAQLALGQMNTVRAAARDETDEFQRLMFTAIVEARTGNRAVSDLALAKLRRFYGESCSY